MTAATIHMPEATQVVAVGLLEEFAQVWQDAGRTF
jgi:hypothetical protein